MPSYRWCNSHKISFDDVCVQINRGTTFLQTATYNIFCFFLQTRSPQRKYTLSAQSWLIKADKAERFVRGLEAVSPVTKEISDFTPNAHAQNNIADTKYAEKIDDYGLGFGVYVSVSGRVWFYKKKKKINEVQDKVQYFALVLLIRVM